MGVGEAVADKKVMDAAVADLTKITGQKPLITKSQQGDRVLQAARGPGDRLQGDAARRAHVRVPRPPDQHRDAAHPRLPRRVAARLRRPGNYTLGVKEQIIFPEIQYDQIDQIRGMDITITTTATDDRHGRALLEAFNFPFRK